MQGNDKYLNALHFEIEGARQNVTVMLRDYTEQIQATIREELDRVCTVENIRAIVQQRAREVFEATVREELKAAISMGTKGRALIRQEIYAAVDALFPEEKVMHTNEPGREPTDALAEYIRAAEELADAAWALTMARSKPPCKKTFRHYDANNAYMAAKKNLDVYLSGARPMPDTPAPDEVAQLRAEVQEQSGIIARQFELLQSTATALKGDPAPMNWHSFHDLPEIATTLTARVAELEAELAALRNGGSPAGPRPFILTPDGKERKYWAGTKDLGATFPGKEPTDAE